MYELVLAAAVLAILALAFAYSPILDDEFLDAVDDHRRFNRAGRPARPTFS